MDRKTEEKKWKTQKKIGLHKYHTFAEDVWTNFYHFDVLFQVPVIETVENIKVVEEVIERIVEVPRERIVERTVELVETKFVEVYRFSLCVCVCVCGGV